MWYTLLNVGIHTRYTHLKRGMQCDTEISVFGTHSISRTAPERSQKRLLAVGKAAGGQGLAVAERLVGCWWRTEAVPLRGGGGGKGQSST